MFAGVTDYFVMAFRPNKAKPDGDAPTTSKKKRKQMEPGEHVNEPAAGAGAAQLRPMPLPLKVAGEDDDDDDDEDDDDDDDDDDEGTQDGQPQCTQEGNEMLQKDKDTRVAALTQQDAMHPQYVMFPEESRREGYFKGSNVFESSTVETPRLGPDGQQLRTGKPWRAGRSCYSQRCDTDCNCA
jgi:hypothetical protein